MRRVPTLVFAIVLMLPSAALPQAETEARPAPQPPVTGARDNAAPTATTTARISGRVVSADDGSPLRRAEVMLMSDTLKEPRSTSTDGSGRYEFTELAAGRYRLRASKAGFGWVAYGQRRPFDPGRPLELVDGQALSRVDLALPRGGVIAGRVTDEFGEAVANVGVRAMRYSYAGGKKQLVPVGHGSTDDRGQYRIFGLAAAEYYVSAVPGGGFSFGQSDSRTGFAPTFYPGTPSVSEAQRLRVAAGSEQAAVNFAMIPARTAKVAGTVLDPSGQPASQGYLMLQPGSLDDMSFTINYGGMVQSDGTFSLSSIAPGDYVIHANLGNGEDAARGSLAITVAGEDMSGLTITTAAPTPVSGQVVFDGNPPDKLRPSEFQFFMRPAGPGSMMWGGPLHTKDDWTLEGRGTPGQLIVEGGRLPEGWMVKAILLNGEDVTETGIPLRSGEPLDGLQVVLTSRLTRVNGSASNDLGQVPREYVAILFPEDAALWRRFSRRIRLETPDQQGRFEARGLPPGHYLAVALDYIEEGQQADPEFLESMRPWAIPFELREGETKTIPLKLSAPR